MIGNRARKVRAAAMHRRRREDRKPSTLDEGLCEKLEIRFARQNDDFALRDIFGATRGRSHFDLQQHRQKPLRSTRFPHLESDQPGGPAPEAVSEVDFDKRNPAQVLGVASGNAQSHALAALAGGSVGRFVGLPHLRAIFELMRPQRQSEAQAKQQDASYNDVSFAFSVFDRHASLCGGPSLPLPAAMALEAALAGRSEGLRGKPMKNAHLTDRTLLHNFEAIKTPCGLRVERRESSTSNADTSIPFSPIP